MQKQLRHLFPLLLFLVCHNIVSGQAFATLKTQEDSLKKIMKEIGKAGNDSLKLMINEKFNVLLRETLALEKSFFFPFDSLKPLGKLTSPDKKFRLYLWNIRMSDGRYRFFGFLQQPGTPPPGVVFLNDHSDSINDPEHEILDPDNWYGALYYKIIPVETGLSGTSYTLLGWDGNNSIITQKVIEVLSFGSRGEVTFGARVFKDYLQGENTRIIFRYSAESSMVLKLDEVQITTSKKWNPKKREFFTESRKETMIICDRLIPLDPQLEGLYQHYIPASDTFDGFLFENGKWLFIKDIDPRNKH